VHRDDKLEVVLEINVDYSSGVPEVKLSKNSIKCAYLKGDRVR
jgi:hypothetical protein